MKTYLLLLICGNGSSGKSTMASLLAKSMAKKEFNVLMVNRGESNFGLHRQLGMELPEDFMNFFGGKKEMDRRMRGFFKEGESVNVFDKKRGINELMEEYHTKKDDGRAMMRESLNQSKVNVRCRGDSGEKDVFFKACLAGKELDVDLREIEELASKILGGENVK